MKNKIKFQLGLASWSMLEPLSAVESIEWNMLAGHFCYLSLRRLVSPHRGLPAVNRRFSLSPDVAMGSMKQLPQAAGRDPGWRWRSLCPAALWGGLSPEAQGHSQATEGQKVLETADIFFKNGKMFEIHIVHWLISCFICKCPTICNCPTKI